MQLGQLGVWAATEHMTSLEAAQFAQRVEAWGYGALWLPEAVGRNVLVSSSWLLANTTKLNIATGIANIYGRDAQACFAAQQGLAEQSNGRFLLGLGVSHAPLVQGMRGHAYGKPIATMRAYLEAMQRSIYMSPPPAEKPLTVLAALRPKMIELANELADGVHPYNVTPEHTADTRKRLGAGKLICVEQMAVLSTDAAKARAIARATLRIYLNLPNYYECWRTLGFTDDDWAGEGSDRLVDAMVVWGDETAIRARLQQHLDAGADHVCVQALSGAPNSASDENLLALLAPGA